MYFYKISDYQKKKKFAIPVGKRFFCAVVVVLLSMSSKYSNRHKNNLLNSFYFTKMDVKKKKKILLIFEYNLSEIFRLTLNIIVHVLQTTYSGVHRFKLLILNTVYCMQTVCTTGKRSRFRQRQTNNSTNG